jgi:hypothetical protein
MEHAEYDFLIAFISFGPDFVPQVGRSRPSDIGEVIRGKSAIGKKNRRDWFVRKQSPIPRGYSIGKQTID